MITYKIAIIGCGMAGLSAGMLLARSGYEITSFERFEEPKSVGAGILLQPSGLVALGRLGLRELTSSSGVKQDVWPSDIYPR